MPIRSNARAQIVEHDHLKPQTRASAYEMKDLEMSIALKNYLRQRVTEEKYSRFGTRNIDSQFQHGTNSFPVREYGKTIAPTAHPLAVRFRQTHKRIYRQTNSSLKTG